MTLRIIDNKSVDCTDTEFQLYQEIIKSYDTPRFNGKDLFKGLFESNDKGLITFIRPPIKTQSSLEVYMFLMQLMISQHLRHSINVHDQLAEDMRIELEGLRKERKEVQELIEKLKGS